MKCHALVWTSELYSKITKSLNNILKCNYVILYYCLKKPEHKTSLLRRYSTHLNHPSIGLCTNLGIGLYFDMPSLCKTNGWINSWTQQYDLRFRSCLNAIYNHNWIQGRVTKCLSSSYLTVIDPAVSWMSNTKLTSPRLSINHTPGTTLSSGSGWERLCITLYQQQEAREKWKFKIKAYFLQLNGQFMLQIRKYAAARKENQ